MAELEHISSILERAARGLIPAEADEQAAVMEWAGWNAARRGYHGLYIEMKSLTGRIRPEQADWINRVRAEGYAAFVCHGGGEAVEKLEWYLG